MAQVTIKGFISRIGEVETVGKDKNISKLSMTVIDESGVKSVCFFVDCWLNMIDKALTFKKGSQVMVKARVEDGSYEKTVDGVKKKVYGYRFTATDIIPYKSDAPEDLDKLFEMQKQAQSTAYSDVTPVDEPTPFDEQN